MQNHQEPSQDPGSTGRKPPRAPPISISQPPNPNPSAPPASEPRPPSSDFDSPLQFDSPVEKPPPLQPHPPSLSSSTTKNGGAGGGAIVAVEKFYSPLTSPLPVTPPNDPTPRHHQIVRLKTKEAAPPDSAAVYGVGGGGERKGKVRFEHEDGRVDDNGTGRSFKEDVNVMSKVALGIRVFEVAFCLVSFAVMATDKTQGWTGDSFGRYKEYRFCLAVNIIGFVYAGFQTVDLAYHLATGDHVINHHLRNQFDFVMDQIMAYLLISASSAAATRVVDWELNWGKDEFTEKASASISVAFLAFLTFAMSSLISGCNLCTCDLS